MELTTQTYQDVSVVVISGRFDAQQVSEVRGLMESITVQTANVVVDLHDVNFMDSAALAALVQAMKHCRQSQGDLRVCNLQQPVKVIFELTRLDKAFKIYPSVAEAVASYRDR
ncbi:MAG: STAS domain-containing protein [Anaerolineae bacterium]